MTRSIGREIGIGVVGFGWMGQAHSRSFLRLPTLFPDRSYQPRLVICADSVPARQEQAVGSFGFVSFSKASLRRCSSFAICDRNLSLSQT